MRIFIVGGDGFVGWPVSLRLSSEGHDVTIVDNFLRRRIDMELGVESLTPIVLLKERVIAWEEVTGRKIDFKNVDVSCFYDALLCLIKARDPHVIIHLGEIRAAPYSMKSPETKRRTVQNNISATHNILCAITESKQDIHLIHIGSTGVYGYDGTSRPIPEGYFDFYDGQDGNLYNDFFPMCPGSVYHATKVMDSYLFRFYAINECLRITDLHQGIIWGVETRHTKLDRRLVNRFDYCGDWGTVLNRFIVQGTLRSNITLHGKGMQTRAFINIENTCDCISLAIKNPPKRGDRPCIFNQTTEQLCLKDLAEIVAGMTDSKVVHVPNPRKETEDNQLVLENKKFLSLGLKPILVNSKKLEDVCRIVYNNRHRVDLRAIPCKSYWNEEAKEKCLNTQNFCST